MTQTSLHKEIKTWVQENITEGQDKYDVFAKMFQNYLDLKYPTKFNIDEKIEMAHDIYYILLPVLNDQEWYTSS